MSNLKELINTDLKTAMKSRDQVKVTNLRGLLAAIKQVEIDTRLEVDDSKVIQIIQKEIKMRRDALEFAVAQSRDDLIAQNENEIAIIQTYLGKQLSSEELENIIKEIVSGGSNNIGQIMGTLNSKYKGQFEGKVASQIIKDCLAG